MRKGDGGALPAKALPVSGLAEIAGALREMHPARAATDALTILF